MALGGSDMANEDPGLGLAAAIQLVRSELVQAMAEGQSSPLVFTAGPVTLDFELAFTSGKGGGAGIQAWVVSADFNASRSNTTTHRITITLTPKDRVTGADVSVSDLSPE